MMRQNIRDGMSPEDAKAMYRAEILIRRGDCGRRSRLC